METEGFGWILFELNSDWRDLRIEPEGFDQILFDILIQINPATVSS